MLVDREAPHERYSFENTGKNITDGMRHLGAVIGTIEYRENYVTQKMNNWLDELNMLCDIARIEPQAAYSCFVSWYKHKLTYITIPNISHLLEKIDALIVTKIIPAITGGIYVNPDERYLSHYLQNMMVWVSQYFQSLQMLNFKIATTSNNL